MLSARSWRVARRYALPPLFVGLGLGRLSPRAATVPLACTAGVLLFFRDPDRRLDPDPSLIYAASDGVVTHVESVAAPWLSPSEVFRISTFLSLHNVHVVRSPLGGEVIHEDRLGGRCVPALMRVAAHENRQSRLTIHSPAGPIGVVLVAGALARRITSWVGVGDRVSPGMRLGLIHFGSRTDVVLPADGVMPLVRRGDHLRAGQTPIARIRGSTMIA
jgi:phosphatidylserine decarboxylase